MTTSSREQRDPLVAPSVGGMPPTLGAGLDSQEIDRIATALLAHLPLAGAPSPRSPSATPTEASAHIANAPLGSLVPTSSEAWAHDPELSVPPDLFAQIVPPLFGEGQLPHRLGRDVGTARTADSASTTHSADRQVAPRRRAFDVAAVRADFPILQEKIHGKPLVWLDNAATTHKPRSVIQRLVHYYEHENSNVHRAAHTLAGRSTDAYEAARDKVRRFLGAASPSEIIFVRGTTEAVNLVANTWGAKQIGAGDEIVLSTLEHHSNLVPWQFLAQRCGAKLRFVPVTDRGEVLLGDFERELGPRTKLVAITHVSNALGTVLPVREMVQAAHRYGARVLVDGAQAVSHFPVDVQALDADFYAFSGHKLFAPTGVGVLYGKKALLDGMPPWQGGGNMIDRVTLERSTFADAPMRFEAGTATLAPAVGLGAAIDYLESIGMAAVAAHERELLAYGTECLRRIPEVQLVGTAPDKAGVLSFLVDGIAVEEIGQLLDQDGIAVRAGHHCAQPTMDRFGVTGTVRASLALYNTPADLDALARAIRRLVQR